MTKTKCTKRALLMSALSLLLCVSMLIGSTYAWFTDSVTSGNNIIKSGTLDVTMEWLDGKVAPTDDAAWIDASKGAIFNSTLWEPGYTEVRHIKIANEGTLALKYQLNIVANGEVSELADVIDVYYIDPAEVAITDRAQLKEGNKLGTLTDVLANISTTASGNLKAGEKDTITLALKMQESAGNKYQGLEIGSDFSIQLLATQLTSEFDSFDNMYDENADYTATVGSAAELATALKAGGKIILSSDIVLDEGVKLVVDEGVVAYLNLNGKKLIGGFQTGSTTKHVYPIENRGTLTLTGDGEVSGRGVANYGNLIIESGTYKAIDTNGGACVWNYAGSLTINGGTFETADSAATGATGIYFAAGTQGTINGGKLVSNANQTAAINNLGALTINDMDVASDHNTIVNEGTIVINGGDFELVGVSGQTSNMFYMTSGTTTINAGNFIYDKNDVLDSGHLLTFAGGEVVVNGGNFEGYVTTQLDNYGYASGKATVSGGTFDQNPSKYVAAGYQAFEDNGTYTVKSNASVLTEALAQGGTVTLDKDTVVVEPITIPAGVEVVLNLNGKTITGAGNDATIANDGTMTIMGGTVKNTITNGKAVISNNGTMVLDDVAIVGAPIGTTGYPAYAVTNVGKLTVEDGTSITSDRGAIYMSNGADVTINGGDIAVTDALGDRVLTAHVIYGYGSNSKLTINGGNFALNYAAGKNAGASVICPAGATIEVNGGNFTYAGTTGGQSGIFQNYMGYGAPVNVYGGTYNDTTVKKNLATGYVAVDNGNGTWTVTAE